MRLPPPQDIGQRVPVAVGALPKCAEGRGQRRGGGKLRLGLLQANDLVDQFQPLFRRLRQRLLQIRPQQRDIAFIAPVEETQHGLRLDDDVDADGGVIGVAAGICDAWPGIVAQPRQGQACIDQPFQALDVAPGVVGQGGAIGVPGQGRQLQPGEGSRQVDKVFGRRRFEHLAGDPCLTACVGQGIARLGDIARQLVAFGGIESIGAHAAPRMLGRIAQAGQPLADLDGDGVAFGGLLQRPQVGAVQSKVAPRLARRVPGRQTAQELLRRQTGWL